jgi:hypothetical protein
MVRVQLVIDLKNHGQVLLANAELPCLPARGDTIVCHPERPEAPLPAGEVFEWKVSARRLIAGSEHVKAWVNFNNEPAKAWQREQLAERMAQDEEAA